MKLLNSKHSKVWKLHLQNEKKKRDWEGDKASGWKCPRVRSCSPSRESFRGSLIGLCLPDKHVFDNLMHRRASTIYIHSSLLGMRSCHPTHAGIITVFFVHPSSACIRTCELKAKTLEPRVSEDIASSHLSLITCFLFPLVPLVKSDILAVI